METEYNVEKLKEKIDKQVAQLQSIEHYQTKLESDIDNLVTEISNETDTDKGIQKMAQLDRMEKQEMAYHEEYHTKSTELLQLKRSLRSQVTSFQKEIWGNEINKGQRKQQVKELRKILHHSFSDIRPRSISEKRSSFGERGFDEIDGQEIVKNHEIDSKELQLIRERLGSGTFGEVWKGKYQGVDVAVKKLWKQEIIDSQMEELLSEVQLLSSLRHPNIVTFLGVCTKPGSLQIVTELMSRGSLESFLKNSPKPGDDIIIPDITRKMSIAKNIAQGINWLHCKGPILHLDLKPGNVLLDDNFVAKISDFGISKSLSNITSNLTSSLGSPCYISPEMWEGKNITEKVDVYSFGILLWELFTHKSPFENLDEKTEIKNAVLRGTRPDIPEHWPSLLKELIQSCLKSDPKTRPSFKTMLHDRIFDKIIIQGSCPTGRQFWEQNFLGNTKVPWAVFVDGYNKSFQVEDDPIKMKLFKDLLVNNGNEVTIETFGNIFYLFGDNVPTNIYSLYEKRWFFGDISRDEAEDQLKSKKDKGTFLVRLSSSSPGCFTFSSIGDHGGIAHFKVWKTPRGLTPDHKVFYPTLEELVQKPENIPKPAAIKKGNALVNSKYVKLAEVMRKKVAVKEAEYVAVKQEGGSASPTQTIGRKT